MFAASPVLSVGPQAEGLIIPPSILNADLMNPAVLNTRKRQGREYSRRVKAARIGDTVTVNDLDNALDNDFKANLASNLSIIAPNVGDLNQAAVLAAITDLNNNLTNRLDNLTNRLDNFSNLMYNSSAHNDEDSIIPPTGQGNAPVYLPTTIAQLRALTAARVQGLENYFQLPAVYGMTPLTRKNRIRRHYNVGIMTHVGPVIHQM